MRTGIVVAAGLLLLTSRVAAQPQGGGQELPGLELALEVGQTRLVQLANRVVRISVSEPNVADVQVVTPLQILVTAKAVGRTPIIAWGESDRPFVITADCRRDLSGLRSELKQLFPKEDIQVGSAGDLVVLSGQVSDVRIPARASEVAKLHSERLANLVEVTGDQQVQLEVRFAEVSRSGLRKMGLSFLWSDSKRGYVGELASSTRQPGSYLLVPGTGTSRGTPVVPGASQQGAFNLLFSTALSDFPFSVILSILSDNGLARTLAEPTLVALSGQDASFHAGGEVPILLAQSLGTVSVQFKKFGVQLKFLPTVLGDRTINLKVGTEVSELDPTTGVTLSGYEIPGFKTRNSDTTIRLKDGQSFAIAGLLSDSSRNVVQKIPVLGDIPVLGALFRSTSFQRDESELLVVIRADLVKPLDGRDLPALPGANELYDPDDFQLFLLGQVDGTPRKKGKDRDGGQRDRSGGGPSGPAGFVRE